MYTTRKVIRSTWGVMPAYKDFVAHVTNNVDDDGESVIGTPDRYYWLEAHPGSDDHDAVEYGIRKLSKGLKSKVERECGCYGREKIVFRSLRALYAFIREMSRRDDGNTNLLASGIMGQLGYEWI